MDFRFKRLAGPISVRSPAAWPNRIRTAYVTTCCPSLVIVVARRRESPKRSALMPIGDGPCMRGRADVVRVV